MNTWKTSRIVLFIAGCTCLNVCGKLLAVRFNLPIWGDSLGTVLCAYIAGPVCGALVGVTGNLAYSMINRLSAAYSITSIALAVIIGIAAKRKWFDRFYGFMKAASLVMLTALFVSVPINLLFDNGYTGNIWANGIIDYLLDKQWPNLICSILGQLAIEFADKVITVATVYLAILYRRIKNDEYSKNQTGDNSKMTVAGMILLSFGLVMSMPVNASAQDVVSTDLPDYNDYVQSVYSANNGLPCGEANDIAQTND